MIEKRQFYIGGNWVDPLGADDLEVINPATEQPVAVISLGGGADVDRAVAAAQDAFDAWSQTSVDERAALLERIIRIYERRSGEMDEAIRMSVICASMRRPVISTAAGSPQT